MGRRSRNETLIWTDIDLFTMRYIGTTLVYSVRQLGSNCGVISRHGGVVVDTQAFWMGSRKFFKYDGFVRPISCEVSDFVFNDLNRTQRSKIVCISNSQYNEVTWYYPSSGSTENDRYVTLNSTENHWTIGALERTAGVDKGAFPSPMLADSTGAIYEHETGVDYGSLSPYAESGPIEIGRGDRVMMVRAIVPDDVTLTGTDAKLFGSLYPVETETSVGPFDLANPTDVRITARQVRLRVDHGVAGWRVGVPRLEVEVGGER